METWNRHNRNKSPCSVAEHGILKKNPMHKFFHIFFFNFCRSKWFFHSVVGWQLRIHKQNARCTFPPIFLLMLHGFLLQILIRMNAYLLWCIMTLWNCKGLVVERDVNRWPLWANESTCDPCIPTIHRAQQDKGSESELKQQGLSPSNLWHDCWSTTHKKYN